MCIRDRFNTESFVKAVNMVTGVDFTDFMEKYLYGTEEYPVIKELEEEIRKYDP